MCCKITKYMYSSTGINFLPVDFKTCQKSRKNNIFNNLRGFAFFKKKILTDKIMYVV